MAKLKDIIGEELFKQLSTDKQKEYENKDYEDISGGAYVTKAKFDQVNDQAKEYRKQVGERERQIADLKDQYKDVDGLKDKFVELEKQLSDISFNNALEKGLSSFNVKDKTLIMALLNKENLKVDGDNIIGLKEQIEPLQKSHEYLFEKTPNGTGTFSTGSQTQQEPTATNFATELGKQRAETLKAKSLTDFAK